MKNLDSLLMIFVVACILFSSVSMAYEADDFESKRIQMIDELVGSEWKSTSDVQKSLSLAPGGLAAKSCTSRDGSKDCFCDGGCWRTENSCGCTSESISTGGMVFEMLQ